jgi:hypothetical protein
MVVVAKAAMLSQLESPSLLPIAKSLMEQIKGEGLSFDRFPGDPLLQWLAPESALSVRTIERAINHTFISNEAYVKLNINDALDKVSPLAAFFYVALFRAVRRLLVDFIPSNPTWIKKPKSLHQRKRPGYQKVWEAFISEVEHLANTGSTICAPPANKESDVVLRVGNAEQIPLSDHSVEAIVSSPPYCTRIDYAVATSVELAILGLNHGEFDSLRRSLTGTSTVGPMGAEVAPRWGPTCINFLNRLQCHPSRASKGYYYKNHLQYFSSLSRSLREISRVLKSDGYCILVVQDSHYKEIHNDVPTITAEMASENGLELIRRHDFSSSRSMVEINRQSKKYLQRRNTTESVLCFRRS